MKEEMSIDEIYAIETNNFNSDIMRVRDFFFEESLSWFGDFFFSKMPIKLTSF